MKREWTGDEVRTLRGERFNGATLPELARRHRTSVGYVFRIVHGTIHVHYGGPMFGIGVGNCKTGPKP